MTNLTETIIDSIVLQIGAYNAYCSRIRNMHDIFGRIKLNLHNERTIAHFFDVEIQRKIEHSPSLCAIISECAMHYLVDDKERKTAESEVKIKPNKELKKYISAYKHELYVPDTAIIDYDDKSPSIHFIEYKIDSRFSDCKLALDYLKYKYYSAGLTCCAIFIYVLFYKKDNGIELRSRTRLSRILKPNTAHQEKSIFVFNPGISGTIKVTEETLRLIDGAEAIIGDMEDCKTAESSTKAYRNSSLEKNVFYNYKDCFKPNVIYAKTIQENYAEILELAKRINDGQSIVDYKAETGYSISQHNILLPEFSDNDCIKLSQHFKNQMDKILGDELSSAPEILEYYKKRSTWILILLQKLAEDNRWFDIANNFKFNISNQAVTEYKSLLSQRYEKVPANLNKLCLGLICFIVNLYPLMFNISSENKIQGFNSRYIELNNSKSINSLLSRIISEAHIEIESKVNINDENFRSELLKRVTGQPTNNNLNPHYFDNHQ